MKSLKNITRSILTILFSVLAFIHFNWVFGGKWGFDKVIPSDIHGNKIFAPKTVESLAVGIVLLLMGVFYLTYSKKSTFKILNKFNNIALWIIPIIFLLRAIGDFKYVGFFKQIKGTEFANLDTMVFSPLCLFISVSGYLLIHIKFNVRLND